MASITGNINIQVKNNLDRNANFSLLGGTQDSTNGQANATTLYEWDLSSETFINKECVEIQARSTQNSNLETFTVSNPDGEIDNAQTVVNLLNTLLIGEFNLKDGNIIWIINNDNVYGDLSVKIQPNFSPSQFVKDAYAYFDPEDITGENTFGLQYQSIFDFAIDNVSNFVQNIQASGYGLMYPFVGDQLQIANGDSTNAITYVLIRENTDLPNNFDITTNTLVAQSSFVDLSSLLTVGTRVNSANILFLQNAGLSNAYLFRFRFGRQVSTLTAQEDIPLAYYQIFAEFGQFNLDAVVQPLSKNYLNIDNQFGNQGDSQNDPTNYYGFPYIVIKQIDLKVLTSPNSIGYASTLPLSNWNNGGNFFDENLGDGVTTNGNPIFELRGHTTSGGKITLPTNEITFGRFDRNTTFGIGGFEAENTLVIEGATSDADGNFFINVDWDTLTGTFDTPQGIGRYTPSPNGKSNFMLHDFKGNSADGDATILSFLGAFASKFAENDSDGKGTFVISGEPTTGTDATQCNIDLRSGSYPIIGLDFVPLDISNLSFITTGISGAKLPFFSVGQTVYKYTDKVDVTLKNHNVVWSNGSYNGESSAISYGSRFLPNFGITFWNDLLNQYGQGSFQEYDLDITDNNRLDSQMKIAGIGASIFGWAWSVVMDSGYVENTSLFVGLTNLANDVEISVNNRITFIGGNARYGKFGSVDSDVTPVQGGGTFQNTWTFSALGSTQRADVEIPFPTLNTNNDEISIGKVNGVADDYDRIDAIITDPFYSGLATLLLNGGTLEIIGLTIFPEPVSATNGRWASAGTCAINLAGFGSSSNSLELKYFKSTTNLYGYGVTTFEPTSFVNATGFSSLLKGGFGSRSIDQFVLGNTEAGKGAGKDFFADNNFVDFLFGTQAQYNTSGTFNMSNGDIQMGEGTVNNPIVFNLSNFTGSTTSFVNTLIQIDFLSDNYGTSNEQYTIEFLSPTSNTDTFSWGWQLVNLPSVEQVRYIKDANYTTTTFGGGNVLISGLNDCTAINLGGAKISGLEFANLPNCTLFLLQGNSLPATDPTNGGLSEIIVDINNQGTSNGTLTYSNQTTGAVPVGSICQTAYDNLIARGWTINGSAPSTPPPSSFNNTLNFSGADSYSSTIGFDTYNPANQLVSKTYNLVPNANAFDSIYYYPPAQQEYADANSVSITLPSWVTETGRTFIDVASQPINSTTSSFYTAIKIDIEITGNSSNTTDSVTSTETTTPIEIDISFVRANIDHSNFAGSFTPLSFGLQGTFTANTTDTTTLTVTGTAGDTVGSITSSLVNNNVQTGRDIISAGNIVGLPATVGDTITIGLILTIPNQRRSRQITTSLKAITFEAFDL